MRRPRRERSTRQLVVTIATPGECQLRLLATLSDERELRLHPVPPVTGLPSLLLDVLEPLAAPA